MFLLTVVILMVVVFDGLDHLQDIVHAVQQCGTVSSVVYVVYTVG